MKNKLPVFLSLFFLLFFVTPVMAVVCEAGQTARNEQGQNLSGKELTGLTQMEGFGATIKCYSSFENAHLDKAYISGYLGWVFSLAGVNFAGATMKGFYLKKTLNDVINNYTTQFPSVTFKGANFSGVDFTGAKMYNSTMQPDYEAGNMEYYIDFSGATFSGAKATGPEQTYFGKVNMQNANFTSAQFTNTVFNYNGAKAFFDGANFTQAKFDTCTFDGSSFKKANFNSATFNTCSLNKSLFNGASFSNALFTNCSFLNTTLRGVDFSVVKDFTGTDFTSSDLTGASFNNASLKNNNFNKTTLSGVDFGKADFTLDKGCSFQGANFSTRTLKAGTEMLGSVEANGAKVTDANNKLIKDTVFQTKLSGANFSGIDLTGVNLTGAQMVGTTFYGANFTNTTVDGNLKQANIFFPHDKATVTPSLTNLAIQKQLFTVKLTTDTINFFLTNKVIPLFFEVFNSVKPQGSQPPQLSSSTDADIAETINALQKTTEYNVKKLVTISSTTLTLVNNNPTYTTLLQLALYTNAKLSVAALINAGADLTIGIQKDSTTDKYTITDTNPMKMLINNENEYDAKTTVFPAILSWTTQLANSGSYRKTDVESLANQLWELLIGTAQYSQLSSDLTSLQKNMGTIIQGMQS